MSDKQIIEKQNPMQVLEQYRNKPGFTLLLPLHGDIQIVPYMRIQVARVKIDTRNVKIGGEVHEIHGKYQPSASAIHRFCAAWGITLDSDKCSSEKSAPYVWASKVSGKIREADGTWRSGYAEYEFDANLRGEELRMQMKGKPGLAIEKEIMKLKKFGLQRAVTGATLALVHKLTGMKTAFSSIEELQTEFVIHRYVLDPSGMTPAMQQAALFQAAGIATEIFGPSSERNVTPPKEAVPAITIKEEEKDDLPSFDDVPFGDAPPVEPISDVELIRNWFKMIIHEMRVPNDTCIWITGFLDGEIKDRDPNDLKTLQSYKKALEKKMKAGGGK